MEFQEKRQHMRVPLTLPISGKSAETIFNRHSFQGQIRDMCYEGLGITVKRPDDFKVGTRRYLMRDADIEAGRGIDDPAAVETTDMVMVLGHSVESFETAAELEFLNFSMGGKNLQVAIDGSEADAGKTSADHFIDLIGTGMGADFTQFFQDDLPLRGHPQV